MASTTKLYIDGAFVDPVLGNTFPVTNPATEEVIAHQANGSAEDVEKAVTAARRALQLRSSGSWHALGPEGRSALLVKIADGIEARKEELARLETTNNGKPLCDARGDIQECADVFRYYSGLALTVGKREVIKVCDDNFETVVTKVPIGVVALITPFNYPLLMATWKVAPALAAGCTVVLKPSEITPLTAIELSKVIHEAGLPRGVFNLITGTGPSAGAPLVAHHGVDKYAFTGSVATGNNIYRGAADSLKNCSLELGGKSALIVFDDASLEAAVEWAMFGIFNIGGQICSATSRLLVQQGIAKRFVDRLVECTREIKIGNGLDDGVLLGPLVNGNQHAKVLSYIDRAKQEGSRLVAGGKRPPHLPKGYFVEPTIFEVHSVESVIWREEIFGPVLAYKTFTTEEEAILLANDSIFGLAGGVMSTDLKRCERVADALDVGVAWINCSQPAFREAPWGGVKKSGLQGRDLGHWGMDTFLSVKQITAAKDAARQVGFYTLPPSKL